MGLEPTVELPPYRISSAVLSTKSNILGEIAESAKNAASPRNQRLVLAVKVPYDPDSSAETNVHLSPVGYLDLPVFCGVEHGGALSLTFRR